jgi:hypothetical protein
MVLWHNSHAEHGGRPPTRHAGRFPERRRERRERQGTESWSRWLQRGHCWRLWCSNIHVRLAIINGPEGAIRGFQAGERYPANMSGRASVPTRARWHTCCEPVRPVINFLRHDDNGSRGEKAAVPGVDGRLPWRNAKNVDVPFARPRPAPLVLMKRHDITGIRSESQPGCF